MPAATLATPRPDVVLPRTGPSENVDIASSSPTALVTGDGKTLHQETLDSARAAGIAVLATAAMALAILTGIVMVLIG
jgi:hypothetical protein